MQQAGEEDREVVTVCSRLKKFRMRRGGQNSHLGGQTSHLGGQTLHLEGQTLHLGADFTPRTGQTIPGAGQGEAGRQYNLEPGGQSEGGARQHVPRWSVTLRAGLHATRMQLSSQAAPPLPAVATPTRTIHP